MLLYLVIFIEGLCSLGAEVIALRRLVPHMGSSILVTAPTIGFFLLALALGYASGAKVEHDFSRVVGRNFVVAALIAGVGLSGAATSALFEVIRPAMLAYLVYMLVVLCPIAWLLGQTVPILTNLFRHERVGQASGTALYWSTLGSFLGATGLSLLVMQWFGVSAAVMLVSLGLALGSMLLTLNRKSWLLANLLVMAAVVWINQPMVGVLADTAYAEYKVEPYGDRPNARLFKVNQSGASLVEETQPPRFAPYIHYVRTMLLGDLALQGKDILVLGAGGFTLSHFEPLNRYTYVDIDPAIRGIAEAHLLRGRINGQFVAGDARNFVDTTEQRYSAIVVDVFSSHNSIPGHLATREFWAALRRPMLPGAVLVANLILDGRLESPYARNLLATIESVYGRCSVEVMAKDKPLSNVIVACFQSSEPRAETVYVDERNQADLDRALNM
ncbi:methyltransferase type 12 [Hydrogenophaga crassostreae]|uniref:Methyltransferase type 12 n=1 Tax=Hydrogenophaga crassostreae TaxID=1763535 RepID=A0A167HQP7_9BURK|nr:fused MFS/spermidine synthase [Hydrogenophaga crassostreae]AOW13321.1 methyltransferase type 12 [Hydrogenophaga crassostreae]OAD41602.1 methyltransferase type 12 [Hydrogenophaga crassostreae]